MPVRSVGLVLIPLIAVALAAALLLSVRSSAQAPAAVATQPEPAPMATAAPAMPDAPPVRAAPTPQHAAGYVALIDNSLILRSEFEIVQAIDQAMSALLEIEPAAPDQLLQQMVNHRLVLAAATRAGATPGDGRAALAELLTANGKTQAELAAILQAHAVDPQQFEAYLAELVLVDQFAHKAAASKGTTVAAYVADLQAAARIHLGDPPTATVPATGAFTAITPYTTVTVPATVPATAAGTRGVAVGQLAPSFELERLGAAGKLSFDDLLGKPTVLSFWTTWCPYCLRQTPILVAGATRYAGRDVQFVGVDVAEKPDAVAAYVKEHAIPYPILLDTGSETAAAYNVDGYPTTYFLDAEGRIVAHQIGALSDEQLSTFVEQLLNPE